MKKKKTFLWVPQDVLSLDTDKVNYAEKILISYLMIGKKEMNETAHPIYISWSTSKQAAEHLGLSLHYVFKLLGRLKDKGIVAQKGDTFVVQDVFFMEHLRWNPSKKVNNKGVRVFNWVLWLEGMAGFLDKVVYAHLLSLDNHHGNIWVSNSGLSDTFSIKKNVVSKVLGRLERRGFIGKEIENRREGKRRILIGDYRDTNLVNKSIDMDDETRTVDTEKVAKKEKYVIIFPNTKSPVGTKKSPVGTKKSPVGTNNSKGRRRTFTILAGASQGFPTREQVFTPDEEGKSGDENIVKTDYSAKNGSDSSIRRVGEEITLLSYRIIGLEFSSNNIAGYFRASRGHASRASFFFFLRASEVKGGEGGTSKTAGEVILCQLQNNEASRKASSEKRKRRQDTVPRVNEAIELFTEVFPVEFNIEGKRPYQKIGTRIAIEGVLRTHGFEALEEAVTLFKRFRTNQYYPGTISSVAEFCYKYDKVVAGNERELLNENKHKPAPLTSEGVKPGQMEKFEHIGALTHDMETPLLDAVAVDVLQRLGDVNVPFQWVRKAVYLSACAAIRFWVPDYKPISSLHELYWKRAERDIGVYLQEEHFHADDNVPASLWDKKAIDAMMSASYDPMPYKNYPFFTSIMKERK